MAEAVQVEGGAATDNQIPGEQGLKRDHHLLPDDGTTRPNINAMRRLREPASSFVFAEEVGGVTFSSKPCRIDRQAFRKPLGQMV